VPPLPELAPYSDPDMMKPGLFLILGTCSLLAACDTGVPEDKSAPVTSTAASRKPEAAPVAARPIAQEPARQEVHLDTPFVGLLECDQIAEKYKACLETKVSGVSRTALVHSLDTTLKQWHEVQNRGGGAQALLVECQKAKVYAQKILQPYGCQI
jgi:hypothetical protein